VVGTLTACGGGNDEATDTTQETTETEEPVEETEDNTSTEGEAGEETTDVNTTALIVNEADAFVEAVRENGSWIITTLSDINIDQEVVVAGEFHDKNDNTKDLYRKIAPYTQNEDHKIVDSYTIIVPKMTIQSPNTKIAGGTIKGDVYIEAQGFNLSQEAKIEGNIFSMQTKMSRLQRLLKGILQVRKKYNHNK
jgi:hypothetical protein